MRALCPLLVLLLMVVVITSLAERPKRAVQRRIKRHGDIQDSLRPLRRFKRRWILTTIVLQENDPGPFPKHAGNLFNDRAENFTIKYLISGPGVDEPPEVGLFHINENTGEVFVNRPIDREKTPLFVIRFDAADRANGKILDRELLFNVAVEDLNDNSPLFEKSTYEITIKENADLDNPIFQVKAFDLDKEDTMNSKVTYYIVNQIPSNPDVKFSIDPEHGIIFGKGCLNYQTAGIIRLIVGARDNGHEPMASTTTVVIRLEDVNSNMPVFNPDKYELSVHEGEVKNNLLRLKVDDRDVAKTPGWRAKYTVSSGIQKEHYKLETDPETNEGILSIVKPLDFEGTPTKTIKISVENEEPFYSCQNNKLTIDKRAAKYNATVIITVIDTNDAPVFSPTTKIIRLKEGVKPGTILATLKATDPDRVPNKIRYKIAEDPAGWMTVDENTGVLKTVLELDRESLFVELNTYKVLFHAIDDGEPSETGTGTVLLYLSDVNDNSPQLVEPYIQRCEQLNNMPVIVEAADKDQDPYAGPFRFEFPAEFARSVKQTWDIKQRSDRAVEILMLRNLKKGNYTIPLKIYDRQGTFSQQVLNVRVCSCPDGKNCERMKRSSQLSGGAIGAIVGALLFFLLALCLLVCLLCGTGGKKRLNMLGTNEGNQTMIQYNEEGGSVLSQASPAVLMANGNGNGDVVIKDKEAVGAGRPPSISLSRTRHPSWDAQDTIGRVAAARTQSWNPDTIGRAAAARTQSWNPDGAGIARSASRHSGRSHTWTQNSAYAKIGSMKKRSENAFVERIGHMLVERLDRLRDDEDRNPYNPRTYAYEGELERIDSMNSFAIPDNRMDFTFLDDFDPKFSTLEEICQQ